MVTGAEDRVTQGVTCWQELVGLLRPVSRGEQRSISQLFGSAGTLKRLRTAIDALKAKKQEISVQTIYEESSLRYAAIHHNPEALALFRANSTNLVAKMKQTKRKRTIGNEETISSRYPLLAYKKPQLVTRLRTAQQQLLEVQQQLAESVDASMRREARIAELEAKLATLEPYRSFVGQMRAQMQREEQGRFGDLPSDM